MLATIFKDLPEEKIWCIRFRVVSLGCRSSDGFNWLLLFLFYFCQESRARKEANARVSFLQWFWDSWSVHTFHLSTRLRCQGWCLWREERKVAQLHPGSLFWPVGDLEELLTCIRSYWVTAMLLTLGNHLQCVPWPQWEQASDHLHSCVPGLCTGSDLVVVGMSGHLYGTQSGYLGSHLMAD